MVSAEQLSYAKKARCFLSELGFPARDVLAEPSVKTFPDGERYRVEIPSVEGPRCVEAVLLEGERLGVPIHRLSSGSGISLTSTNDINEMVKMCVDQRVELSLFVGPRAP